MYPGEFYFSIGRHAWERVVRKIGISLAFSSETEDTPDPEVTANKDRPRSRSRDRQADVRTIVCLAFSSVWARDRALRLICVGPLDLPSLSLRPPRRATPSMPSKWTDGHAKWQRTKKQREEIVPHIKWFVISVCVRDTGSFRPYKRGQKTSRGGVEGWAPRLVLCPIIKGRMTFFARKPCN